MKSKIPENKFGEELERLRELLTAQTGEKWSQKKVAEAVGVTTQAYQNWIHGRRGKSIDIVTLKKLSDVLSADFLSLLRLARPDLIVLLELSGISEYRLGTAGKARKRIDYPSDVFYIADILKLLYNEDKREFQKIKRIVTDFYPEIAAKVKKRKN